MNYLAHLHLSPCSTHAIVGNLMGDFRKHITDTDLPEDILLGIENHCRVDRFTDSHAVVGELKQVFSSKRRRFAGIILDVAFDHYLSRYWHEFHDQERRDYIRYAYDCLQRGRGFMPSRMQHTVHYMIAEDWLGSYIDLDGIDTCLNRISKRIRFENNLYGAVEEVESHYAELEAGFLEFFPHLTTYVNRNNLTGVKAGMLVEVSAWTR